MKSFLDTADISEIKWYNPLLRVLLQIPHLFRRRAKTMPIMSGLIRFYIWQMDQSVLRSSVQNMRKWDQQPIKSMKYPKILW